MTSLVNPDTAGGVASKIARNEKEKWKREHQIFEQQPRDKDEKKTVGAQAMFNWSNLGFAGWIYLHDEVFIWLSW